VRYAGPERGAAECARVSIDGVEVLVTPWAEGVPLETRLELALYLDPRTLLITAAELNVIEDAVRNF
jgi:hypothetical protein